jgi:hypothetical protein
MKRTPNVPRANREVVLSAAKLTEPEIRCIVTNYYDAQEMRKRGDMQLRHLGSKDDPEGTLNYWATTQAKLEVDMEKILRVYAENHPVGQWMLAQHGVGAVITAGLLAHIDIEQAPTVGHIWRYAGLDPTSKWEKGEKRPFNAQLKQITWHTGQCFMRTHNHENSFYGRIYKRQKELVVERNENGAYAERAKMFRTLSADVKKILKTGKLPPNNLDAQARRFAVKIFLSHMHAIWFWHHYKQAPAKPFAISVLGHAHEIRIPGTDMFPGFEEAYYGRKLSEAAE